MPNVAAQFIFALLVVGQIVCPARAFADPLLQIAPIEHERGRPSPSVEIPPFPTGPGTRRFVIFNNVPSLESRLLYLRVPDEFAGPDTAEPTRMWGLNLLVHGLRRKSPAFHRDYSAL